MRVAVQGINKLKLGEYIILNKKDPPCKPTNQHHTPVNQLMLTTKEQALLTDQERSSALLLNATAAWSKEKFVVHGLSSLVSAATSVSSVTAHGRRKESAVTADSPPKHDRIILTYDILRFLT